MFQTINLKDFRAGLRKARNAGYNSFSKEGEQALFHFITDKEKSGNEETEFDPFVICEEWREFNSADECACEYFDYSGMTYDEDGGELLTVEEVEKKAFNYLERNGNYVIRVGDTGRIISY